MSKVHKSTFLVTFNLVLFNFVCVLPREHEGTERDTEGVGCDMS